MDVNLTSYGAFLQAQISRLGRDLRWQEAIACLEDWHEVTMQSTSSNQSNTTGRLVFFSRPLRIVPNFSQELERSKAQPDSILRNAATGDAIFKRLCCVKSTASQSSPCWLCMVSFCGIFFDTEHACDIMWHVARSCQLAKRLETLFVINHTTQPPDWNAWRLQTFYRVEPSFLLDDMMFFVWCV